MKKYDDTLFKIGEVIKIMDITRKTLLVYEDMGLLTPAIKDEESGYRYYSADNMTQIRAIKSLQSLGLTLKEIQSYYYDSVLWSFVQLWIRTFRRCRFGRLNVEI